MALEWLDGFSIYRDAADLANRYTVSGDSAMLAMLPGDGPSLNGAMQVGGDVDSAVRVKVPLSATAIKKLGFWFRVDELDASSSYDNFLSFDSTDTIVGSVRFLSTGAIAFRDASNGTLLFDTTNDGFFLTTGVAQLIEFRVSVASSAIGQLQMYVDGILRGETLVWSGTSTFNAISFRSGETGDGILFSVADLYVYSSDADSLLINWKVQKLTMDADTALADFTPINGGDNVDEIDDTVCDLDATYNVSNTTNHEDRFTTADTLAGSNTQVKGLNVAFMARSDTVNANMRGTCYSGSTKGSGSSVSVLAGDYLPYFGVFLTNPDTAADWTPAEVEAAEYGYELL